MHVSMADLLPLLPELWVLSMSMAILLVGLYLDERRQGLVHFLSMLTLVVAAILTLRDFGAAPQRVFGGMFVRDALGDVLKLFMYLTSALVFVYAKHALRMRRLFQGEFYVLVLCALLGMMVLVSAGNLVQIYLGLELLALSSYALVAFDRDSPTGSEAAMKYFVLGALASGLMLYGMSLLYGMTGTLDLGAIAAALKSGTPAPLVSSFALVFIVVGIGFKFGAVPFHMWLPDVYQGAPTATTLFVASVPKLAAVGMAFRLLHEGLLPLLDAWQDMLAALAILSLVVGNLAAIVQTNLKRMLAYSTISHVGFILLGVLNGSPMGNAAALFYAVVYGLTSAAAFGVIIALSPSGVELEEIDDYKGLNRRHPWYALLMLLVMASLAGFPPFVGFFAKLLVLQAALATPEIGLGLAVVAALFAVIGAYYYLRVIKVMYFDEPESELTLAAPQDVRYLLSLNALALLLLGLFWNPLIRLCQNVWV